MITKRNIIIFIGFALLGVIILIVSILNQGNTTKTTLVSKDKLDISQSIVTYKDSVFFITTDGQLKQITNNTVTTIGPVNINFSPKISYDGNNISYINPTTRDLTVYKTTEQGSKTAPIVKVGGVAFSQWQDESNIAYVQFEKLDNNYNNYFNSEEIQPNIKGRIYSTNINTKAVIPLGDIYLQDLLLSNPAYILYSYRESIDTYTINKLDIQTKGISQLPKQNLNQRKIINNNNILIESPQEDYPKLIQGSEVKQLNIPTDILLISGISNQNILNTYSIIKKKDQNIFTKTNIQSNQSNTILELDTVITNPINLALLDKKLIVFTQDGIYLVSNDEVKE